MGQKIHPIGFRLSVLKNWTSKWYANSKNFAGMLADDIKVRDFLKNSSVLKLGADQLRLLGDAAVTLAKAEGLDAHARSVSIRLNR